MKKVAGDAAEEAGNMVMEMIKKEAADEAKKAADESKDWATKKKNTQAANAAAAMEPFHLMMLREQKISAIDYENAKKAMAAAKDLNGKGQKLAADAQALQAAGLIYQANQLMQEAHGTMSGAQSLQENAKKLYASASAAGGRAGYYVWAAQQAAAAKAEDALAMTILPEVEQQKEEKAETQQEAGPGRARQVEAGYTAGPPNCALSTCGRWSPSWRRG